MDLGAGQVEVVLDAGQVEVGLDAGQVEVVLDAGHGDICNEFFLVQPHYKQDE